MMLPPPRSGLAIAILAVVFGAVLAVKVAVVWVYAPLALGDNGGFIEAANRILAGSRWLWDAGLADSATPPTIWRPIGYSLVIAGAKAAFGTGWSYALCSAQAALSFVAGLLVFRLCILAGLGTPVAATVFAAYEMSVPLSTDALVMEDALIGALGATALCIVMQPIVAGRAPSPLAFLGAGLLCAASFLIRDVFHFVVPVLAALTFIVLACQRRWRAAIMSAVALAGPVFLIAAMLQTWNYYRTGHAVITTAGQTAYLYGLLRAAKHDPSVIAGPTLVEQVLRETNKTFDYVDTRSANEVLFRRYGMNSAVQAVAGQSLFWRALFSHPAAFFKASIERFRFVQQATLFASPLTRIDDLHWWAGGATEEGYRTGWRADALAFLQSRDVSKLTIPVFFNLGIRAVCQTIGIVMFTIFLIGTPLIWLLMRDRLGGPGHAALVAWLVYGLFVGIYVQVSFEVRYLSPVIGPALFALAVVVCGAWRWWRVRAGPMPKAAG